MQILAARLPMAVSVNALYDRSKRLTADAREYRQQVMMLLHSQCGEIDQEHLPPYFVEYKNEREIALARSLVGNKSRSKAIKAQKKTYCLKTQVVFGREGADLDNIHKLLQDVVSDFLGFNDSRVIKIVKEKLVIPTVTPHIDIVVEHIEVNWHDGLLLWSARQERNLDLLYCADIQESENRIATYDLVER
jgi:Holliday junction resolvase RusA-like endonuclease